MVGVASHFEVLSLRMMLFLVPTFFLVFSICALYENVRYSVTPRYTWSIILVRVLWPRCSPRGAFLRKSYFIIRSIIIAIFVVIVSPMGTVLLIVFCRAVSHYHLRHLECN